MLSRHAIVSETASARAVGTTRDLRIDLFRGLALWMIFIDHIDGNWLGKFTYRNFGFSDSKEIFIFLSGISCWLLYAKLEAQRGLAWAQFRALYRAVQIYLGYLFVAFFTFVTLFALQRLAEPYFAPGGDFTLLFSDPPRALIAAADLYYTPGYLDILPLYLWLVAAAPLLIAALRRAPRLALLASGLLWLAAETGAVPELPSLDPSGAVTLNPFSWQFLFCLGLWVGQHFYGGNRRFTPTRSMQLLCGAIVLTNLLCSALDHVAQWPIGQHLPQAAAIHGLRETVRTAHGAHLLALIHFLAVAYLVAAVLPAAHKLLRSFWARPLVLTGQFSLQSFCLGTVMSMLGTLYGEARGPGPLMQLLVALLGCMLMVLLAAALAAMRRERPAAVAPHRPAPDWSASPLLGRQAPEEAGTGGP